MSAHIIHSADNGKTLGVLPGDTVQISLGETSSGGYRWQLEHADPRILRLDQQKAERELGGATGAGARRLFQFTAVTSGATDVSLKLWREWLGDKSIIERFRVRIHVT